MSKKTYHLLSEQLLHRGHFSAHRRHFSHTTYGGDWSPELVLEVFELGEAACVLPWDPVLDRVVLVEQFRGAVANLTETPWLLETIAGDLRSGEDPADVARREAREEAALDLDRLHPIGTILPSPGAVATRVHMFVAPCDSTRAGGVHGLDEEGEDILVCVLDRAEAMSMIDDGRIVAAHATMPLLWLALHRVELLEAWC